MRKLFVLGLLVTATITMVSCGEDDVPSVTDAEKQLKLFSESEDALAAKVSTNPTEEGMTTSEITTAFDGWTASFSSSERIDAGRLAANERVNVTANISENATWTSDKIYQLDGRITVLDGATLTVEAGTRIEGNSELSGADAAVLMVARGGKLMAIGTADNPIIMTATDDDGTLDKDAKGLWGGLVILGRAPVSAKVADPQIEGVTSTDTNGLYGGTDSSDDSGTIKYVSIRHGGAIIDASAGDEINGLTLGGVGSGTTIEYIEVYANSDDGVEFFGGSVDVSNVLVYAVGDDAIDVDQSYGGAVRNFTVYVDANSDEGLEIDGREGTIDDKFTLSNGTILALDGASITCDFKSKAKGAVSNLNANGGTIKLSASFDIDLLEETEDAALNVQNDQLTFTSVNASFAIYTEDLPDIEL